MTKKRSSGEGTIYKQPDGLWHGQIKLPNGKRKGVYGKKQKEVQEKLAVLRREIDAGLHGISTAEQTLKQFAEDWVERHSTDRRTKTISGYKGYLLNHLDVIGDILLSKLRPLDVQNHYTRKLETLSSTTVNHIHSFIRVVLESAVRLGIIPRNPAAYTDVPGIKTREMVPLSETQMKLFLASIAHERDKTFWVMALSTGMREAELLGLRWSDVDWERSQVRVRATLHRLEGEYVLEETKNVSSQRVLPLPIAAVQVLKEQQAKQEENKALLGNAWQDKWGLIFTTDAGMPIHATPLLRRFRRILSRLDLLESIRIHDLRHTFATLLIERGVHIKLVSELLGHSSINITLATYGHVTPRMKDAAILQLNELIQL